MVITALPMFGDYYTNGYLSGSPRTEMIGNQIEFYLRGTSQPQIGAALVLILSAFLLVLMAYYLVTTDRAPTGDRAVSERATAACGGDRRGCTSSGRWSPCSSPCSSRSTTGAAGRRGRASRSAGTGSDPVLSVWHDEALRTALREQPAAGRRCRC